MHSLFHKFFNNFNNCINIVGSAGMNCCFFNSKSLSVGEIFGNIHFRKFFYGNAHFICLVYHFIVNIGKILNKFYLHAFIFKISAESLKNYKRPGISYMEKVINCRTAGIHAHLARFYGHKFFLLSCHAVIQFHFIYPPN